LAFGAAIVAKVRLNISGSARGQRGIKSTSCWCLVMTIVALGMRTSLKAMAEVGGYSIALVSAETLLLAGLMLTAVVWRM
jgi:uncharacterized membrane protein YadS